MKGLDEKQDDLQINAKNRHEFLYEYHKLIKKKKEKGEKVTAEKVIVSGLSFS